MVRRTVFAVARAVCCVTAALQHVCLKPAHGVWVWLALMRARSHRWPPVLVIGCCCPHGCCVGAQQQIHHVPASHFHTAHQWSPRARQCRPTPPPTGRTGTQCAAPAAAPCKCAPRMVQPLRLTAPLNKSLSHASHLPRSTMLTQAARSSCQGNLIPWQAAQEQAQSGCDVVSLRPSNHHVKLTRRADSISVESMGNN